MLMKVYESEGITEYLDYKSIKTKTNSDICEVEEIVDFENPRKLSTGELYSSMRIKAEYDLKKNLRKPLFKLACSDAMGGGIVLVRDSAVCEWEEIITDSNAQKKIELLIQNKKISGLK